MTEKTMTYTVHQLLNDHPFLAETLGEKLYRIIADFTIRNQNQNAYELTQDNCIMYFKKLSTKRTHICSSSKSVIYDGLANVFPDVYFEESPPELDHAGDIDCLGYVGEKAFGIRIKPTTAKANFGNYSVSERMRNSFAAFQEDFSGKVFIVFSLDGEIGNPGIIPEIAAEIERLQIM